MIAEATVDEFILPNEISKDVFMHLKYKYESPFWCKENLINLAVNRLTSSNLNWQYVAWIDSDITFLNTNWVQETIQELKKAHFVQLFSYLIKSGPNNEALEVQNSYTLINYLNTLQIPKMPFTNFAPGISLACTRWAFENTLGLIDFNIVGGGDNILMNLLTQRLETFLQTRVMNLNISSTYINLLWEKQNLYKQFNINLSFIRGAVLSHWHGKRVNRNYIKRWKILRGFDPSEDLIRNVDGLLNLSKKGKRMENELYQYFLQRDDDNLKY